MNRERKKNGVDEGQYFVFIIITIIIIEQHLDIIASSRVFDDLNFKFEKKRQDMTRRETVCLLCFAKTKYHLFDA